MSASVSFRSENSSKYYVTENGWFTSSVKSVTKEEFLAHQSNRNDFFPSVNAVVKTVAMGVLGLSNIVRNPICSGSVGGQLALSGLALHAWSQVPSALAQPSTIAGLNGKEFIVQTAAAGPAYEPTLPPNIAVLSDGSYAVVWQNTGFVDSVSLQRLDWTGEVIGDKIRLGQRNPSIASLQGGGGFVVAWCDEFSGVPDTIQMQLFDNAGNSKGNQTTVIVGRYPQALGLRDGGFIIFSEKGCQRFNAQGETVGNVFGQNGTYQGNAVELTGGEVVIPNLQNAATVTQFLFYNELGAEVYNTTNFNMMSSTTMAALTNGGFVIISGTKGQIYDNKGAPVGSEFAGMDETMYANTDYNVIGLEDGGFLIYWNSIGLVDGYHQLIPGGDGLDGSGKGVIGQQFDNTGKARGNPFPLSIVTAGDQYYPATAPLRGGGFVAVWYTKVSGNSSFGDAELIKGRIFTDNSTILAAPVTTPNSNLGTPVSGMLNGTKPNSAKSTVGRTSPGALVCLPLLLSIIRSFKKS